jgi:hypothetical protein
VKSTQDKYQTTPFQIAGLAGTSYTISPLQELQASFTLVFKYDKMLLMFRNSL